MQNRLIVQIFVALMLSACAPILDSNAWVISRYKSSAEFLFEPEQQARAADPQPDVKSLVRDNISSVFGQTEVRDVRVAAPQRQGYGWIACIGAEVVGVMKGSIGRKYFVLEIDRGQVGLRREAVSADRCEAASFEPI